MALTPERVLKADFRKDSDRNGIQRALRNFKSCRDYPMDEDLPFQSVEKLLSSMMLKYAIDPLDFFAVKQDGNESNIVWSCGIKKLDGHSWLGTAYGLTLYEVVCKVVLFLFLNIKSGAIGLRNETTHLH
jgi:hypothetical protein